MTNLFGHSIRSELLLLYICETLAGLIAASLVLVAAKPSAEPLHPLGFIGPAAILVLCSAMISGVIGLYQPAVLARASRLLLGTVVASLLLLCLAWPILGSVAPVLAVTPVDQTLILLAFIGFVVAGRLAFLGLVRSGRLRRRIAYVQDGPVTTARNDPFDIALTAPAKALTPWRLRAAGIHAVVAENPQALPAPRRAAWRAAGIGLLSAADFAEQRLCRIVPDSLSPAWLSDARATWESPTEEAYRRAIDVVASVILLVATLPVLALTVLAIRLESPGPIFYRQERVGRDGKVFSLIKFRSMVVDAEAGGTPRWASKRDPRVTRVGRIIRLTRIDEIPQVFNVLQGDMALIGPRPERPAFVEQLARQIPRYRDRLIVKPGITGWAQVNYPYGASVEDSRMKLAYDLYYIRRRSLFLDLLIVIATIRVVLFREGSR